MLTICTIVRDFLSVYIGEVDKPKSGKIDDYATFGFIVSVVM